MPARSRALIAKLPERSRERAAAQIAALAVTPAAACCIEGFRKDVDGADGIDGRLFVLLEGSATLLDRATRELRSSLGRAGVPETLIIDAGAPQSLQRIIDAQIAAVGERSVTYRSLGLPHDAERRATALRDAANGVHLFTDVLLDLMNGDVFLRVSDRDSRAFAEKIERCDDALRTLDPASVVVAGNSPIRATLRAWGRPPQAIDKMRALKQHFDPNGILNPGRFVGGI